MRLIGAGLPRTGTLSQKVALEMLGAGPCYHMVNVLGDLDEVSKWQRALDGEENWGEIFGGFQATVDWPGAYFYRELVEAYPDAKVLLSVRDGDAWARSMRDTIWGIFFGDIVIKHLSSAWRQVDPKWERVHGAHARDVAPQRADLRGAARSGLDGRGDRSLRGRGAAHRPR